MDMRDRRTDGRGTKVRTRRAIALAGLLLCVAATTVAGQTDSPALRASAPHGDIPPASRERPFATGERLVYAVRVGGVGGTAEMSVSGPVDLRGTDVLVLRSVMKAGVGPITGSGRTESWLEPERMMVLRFVKRERRMLAKHSETVEVFPETRRWTAADGTSGATPTGDPLDELSFIYFIRTLPLTADTTFEVSRHFDAERNPVGLRILGRETVSTRAGEFATVAIEMRVRDPHNYRGEGVIRIHLTDDACRLPVRIESTMPDIGKTVLTLESATRPGDRCIAPQR
jgi:hypothetical protein